LGRRQVGFLERGEAAPSRSAREMGAAVTQTPWRFRCRLGRGYSARLEGHYRKRRDRPYRSGRLDEVQEPGSTGRR